MTHTIRVLIRGSDYKIKGEIDNYTSLTIVPRFNAVGNWVMELNAGDSKAALLNPQAGSANPGAGIIVMRNDRQIFSGPVRTFGWQRTNDSDRNGKLTVGGPDDLIVFAERLVWPVPANAITAQGATQFYSISGAATPLETLLLNLANVSAGPGARVERRLSGLTIPASLGRGTATAYRSKWRFETVIEAMADIARAAPVTGISGKTRGALGFRVVQVGQTLALQVYVTTDRVNTAKFSFELGNLIEATYDLKAPDTTVAVLGAGRTASFTNGPQVAANLAIYERTDALFPGIRNETFIDVGEIDPTATDFAAQLDERAQQHFDEASGSIGMTIKPIDTPQLAFAEDWFIGDVVQARQPYGVITEQVREATIQYGDGIHEKIDATIGTENATSRRTPGIYKRITDLTKLIKKKEATV